MSKPQERGRGAAFESDLELLEYKTLLKSNKADEVRLGMRRVVSAMTRGVRVIDLLPSIQDLITSNDLQVKKLAHLCVINLLPIRPATSENAVRAFRADSQHHNALVRGLAIRSMSCINLPQLHEITVEVLKSGLADSDPYVRKTSVIAVGKLWRQNPKLVESSDLLDTLRTIMGRDDNAMVMASAVCVFHELYQCTGRHFYQLSEPLLKRLLIAMSEANEWTLVYLLEAVSDGDPPENPEVAVDVINRVKGRLKHSNAAIVLATAQVLFKYLAVAGDKELKTRVFADLAPSLITLLNEHASEIKYVTLRNLNVIIQAHPELFSGPKVVNHFFCKYDDPYYVKIEKLEIMIRLASLNNIKEVLVELKDYAKEVDVEFVRRSVGAIGRCAIKLDRAAEHCVKMLLDLIQDSQRPGSRVAEANYVVQEALVVIRDIFRKYPNRYERIISTLCEYLETLDEPNAKGALIWIVGEYSDRIDNSPELLEQFLVSWHEDQASVRLSLLTACVKLYLKRPVDGKPVCLACLKLATEREDNPDLRDRGYMYWRLIGKDPEMAKGIILADRPAISDSTFALDQQTQQVLLGSLGSLASIFYKEPVHFVSNQRFIDGHVGLVKHALVEEVKEDLEGGNIVPGEVVGSDQLTADILDLSSLDFGGWGESDGGQASAAPELPELVTSIEGMGLRVTGEWTRRDQKLVLHLVLHNHSNQTLTQFAVKFNRNTYCLAARDPVQVDSIAPNAWGQLFIDVDINPGAMGDRQDVQVALKSELAVNVFSMDFNLTLLLEESAARFKEDKQGYVKLFSQMSREAKRDNVRPQVALQHLSAMLEQIRVYVTATVKRQTTISYYSASYKDQPVLLEVAEQPNGSVNISAKSHLEQAELDQVLEAIVNYLQ